MDPRLLDLQKVSGLERSIVESETFDRIVTGVTRVTSNDVFATETPPGIAVYAFGSPARIEIVGGDSDADVLFVEGERTPLTTRLRTIFRERLGQFDYSKVDMTEWGSLEEIERYLEKSLVEGNQIIEARFLWGDQNVNQRLTEAVRRHDTIESGLFRIIFNRMHFNQYFSQRVRGDAPNVKYCHGGSRDYLFVYWFDRLDKLIDGEENKFEYKAQVAVGLDRLKEKRIVTNEEHALAMEAINFMIILRGDILQLNKKTDDKGLTFLDADTLKRLQYKGYPKPNETYAIFEKYRTEIVKVVDKVWEATIQHGIRQYGGDWGRDFRLAYATGTEPHVRAAIPHNNRLIRIGLIWGASNSGQVGLYQRLAYEYQGSDDWCTIGSILSSPHCPPEILHYIGTGIAKEIGYGYLLRIIGRHQNVRKETLLSIANDQKLEKRYTEVAQAALQGGMEEANRRV